MRGLCRGCSGKARSLCSRPQASPSPRFPPAQRPPLVSYKPRPLQLRAGQGWPCSSKSTPRVTLPNLILTYSKVLPKTNYQGDRANAGWRFCAKGRRICHSFQVKLLHNPMISSGLLAPRRRWQSCGHGSAQAPELCEVRICRNADLLQPSPCRPPRPSLQTFRGETRMLIANVTHLWSEGRSGGETPAPSSSFP